MWFYSHLVLLISVPLEKNLEQPVESGKTSTLKNDRKDKGGASEKQRYE